MSNSLSKDVQVIFENILPKFEENLVLSNLVKKKTVNQQDAERSQNVMWETVPYIAQSYTGVDATANMKNLTELAVPSSISEERHSTFRLTAQELNDLTQEDKAGEACAQTLASDINQSVADVLTNQGSLVVARTTAAAGFDDVAECDTILNQQGVVTGERVLALSSSDYNAMAGNLANRANMVDKTNKAYTKGYVGEILGFDTYKQDFARTIAAGTAGAVTVNGADQYYTPQALDSNNTLVDNRYQNLAVTVGANTLAVGDCLTIAGVYAVHHINKESTGGLKTFRITAIISGAGGTGTIEISPPIISGGGNTTAELNYKNVDATPATGAAITLLNTTAAKANPFWIKDSVIITPGSYAMKSGRGVDVASGTTENGIELTITKALDDKTTKNDYILRVRYGVTMLNPEMAGILLFSQ